MIKNCWEFMNCPEDRRGECSAYPSSGNSCWLVAGTLCERCKNLSLFAQQIESCTGCPWYIEVNGEYPKDLDAKGLSNCWELWNCDSKETCPAYPDDGAYCWTIAGTQCKKEVSCKFAKIYERTQEGCQNCPWRVYRVKKVFV